MIKRLVAKESLETHLGAFQEKIKVLQSKVVTKDNAYQKLEIKCKDIEQCICRLCMLTHGVEYTENDDVMNKVEKLL